MIILPIHAAISAGCTINVARGNMFDALCMYLVIWKRLLIIKYIIIKNGSTRLSKQVRDLK